MKLLLVSSTWLEVRPLELFLLKMNEEGLFREHAIEIMIAGIGGVATAYHLGKMLPLNNWDLVIQLGICGSFNTNLSIGTTVNVTVDCFADLGAQSDEQFLDCFELGFADKNKFPFNGGWLINSTECKYRTITALPQVKGISLNTVSGNEGSIEKSIARYHADVESMEGAAFLFCCLLESIPFLQLRAISNYVEKRDRNKWNIPLAIERLNDTAILFLKELLIVKNGS